MPDAARDLKEETIPTALVSLRPFGYRKYNSTDSEEFLHSPDIYEDTFVVISQ